LIAIDLEDRVFFAFGFDAGGFAVAIADLHVAATDAQPDVASNPPQQRIECAFGDDVAPVDDRDPMANVFDLFHVVAGVDDGHAFAGQLPHRVEQVAAALWIDADGRF